jgi:hypothetical protein
MPFPIAIGGLVWAAVGGGIVAGGIVGGVINHDDHSDYSDIAERREEERAKRKREDINRKIESEKRRLNSAQEELKTLLHEAIAQMEDSYRVEGIDIPDELSQIAYKIKESDDQAEFSKMTGNVSSIIKKSVKEKLDSEMAIKRDELDQVNRILERVAEFRLTGK